MRAERPPEGSPRATHPASAREAGRRRRAHAAWIAEMAVMFVILLVLDQAMRPGVALLEASPHPFWLPVLAMAALYGLTAGLAAAALGIVLLAWTAPSISPAAADHFTQWMQFWKEPVLWLLAVLALGLHCDREAARRSELETRAAEAEARSETLAAYAVTLRSHVGRLEREVALAAPRSDEAGGADDPAPPKRTP